MTVQWKRWNSSYLKSITVDYEEAYNGDFFSALIKNLEKLVININQTIKSGIGSALPDVYSSAQGKCNDGDVLMRFWKDEWFKEYLLFTDSKWFSEEIYW